MDTLVIGPFVLQQQLVLLLAAAAGGYALLRFRLRGTSYGSAAGSIFVNSLVIVLLTWKLSLLLVDPVSVWNNPMALLYFNGGTAGLIAAVAAAGLYVVLAGRALAADPASAVDSLLLSLLGGYTLYEALLLWATADLQLSRVLTILIGAASIIFWVRTRMTGQVQQVLQRALGVLIAFALLHALGSQLTANRVDEAMEQASIGLKTGQLAPDFELEELRSGRTLKLSDYRGRIVVVNFWATWCPPCRAEMPHMQSYHEAQGEQGTVILSVNATSTEASVPVVESWAESWKLSFPIVLDPQGSTIDTYKVNSYPTTYIIDREGVIRYKHGGPMNEQMLEDAVKQAEK